MIQRIVNGVTMYRLVMYGLLGLLLISLVVSLFGRLSFDPVELIVSVGIICIGVYASNKLLAKAWNVPANQETWLITALILVFILQPAHDVASGLALLLAAVASSAVKFLIAPYGKHVFNPAAFGAAVVSVAALQPSTWWVGTSALWPFTLILALAIIAKIRRYALAITFFAATIGISLIQFAIVGHPVVNGLLSVVTASPLLFLGGVMLTEPSTMPPSRSSQILFSVIIATLFVLAPTVGPLIVYPEVALLVGNIYAFAVSPKRRYRMTLSRVERISERVYNYVFTPHMPISYAAGQYMEWTMPGVANDGRGNRRSFTLASSPTEPTVQVGLKYYDPSSTFKQLFAQLSVGDFVYAGQLSGHFTLEDLWGEKLVFIAGGVGITPFRSMIKQLVDERQTVDCVLLYAANDAREIAYRDVFSSAARFGVRFIPVAPNGTDDYPALNDRVNGDMIRSHVPDYAQRIFMVSGPNSMVEQTRHELMGLGIKRSNIKTDYFSGY